MSDCSSSFVNATMSAVAQFYAAFLLNEEALQALPFDKF